MDNTDIKYSLYCKEIETITFESCESCDSSGFGNNHDGSCPSCFGHGDQRIEYLYDRVF